MAKAGGYGKPPKKNQWKPGQSGNPKGRPKKPDKQDQKLDFSKSIIEASMTLVNIDTNNGKKQMPIIDIIAKKLMQQAANGCISSQRLVGLWLDKFFLDGGVEHVPPQIIAYRGGYDSSKTAEENRKIALDHHEKEKNSKNNPDEE